MKPLTSEEPPCPVQGCHGLSREIRRRFLEDYPVSVRSSYLGHWLLHALSDLERAERERDTLRSDCIALATAGDKRIQKWMDKATALEERIKELEDMLEDARDGHIEQQKIAEHWAEDCEKSKDLHRQAVEDRDRIYAENRRLRYLSPEPPDIDGCDACTVGLSGATRICAFHEGWEAGVLAVKEALRGGGGE